MVQQQFADVQVLSYVESDSRITTFTCHKTLMHKRINLCSPLVWHLAGCVMLIAIGGWFSFTGNIENINK